MCFRTYKFSIGQSLAQSPYLGRVDGLGKHDFISVAGSETSHRECRCGLRLFNLPTSTTSIPQYSCRLPFCFCDDRQAPRGPGNFAEPLTCSLVIQLPDGLQSSGCGFEVCLMENEVIRG